MPPAKAASALLTFPKPPGSLCIIFMFSKPLKDIVMAALCCSQNQCLRLPLWAAEQGASRRGLTPPGFTSHSLMVTQGNLSIAWLDWGKVKQAPHLMFSLLCLLCKHSMVHNYFFPREFLTRRTNRESMNPCSQLTTHPHDVLFVMRSWAFPLSYY